MVQIGELKVIRKENKIHFNTYWDKRKVNSLGE